MSRIKKRGLDYFPMNTDFLHDRLVRRILKREGDAAMAVLLQTYCAIYAGEGYYVTADALFFDDLSDSLFQQEPCDVERILRLAVEYGLFDPELFDRHHILTSADIQRQFLFITKRRTSSVIDARYCLLDPGELSDLQPAPKAKSPKELPADDAPATDSPREEESPFAPGAGNAADIHNNETFPPEIAPNPDQSTQSIAQHSIAQETKENSLFHSSPGTGGTGAAARTSASEGRAAEENLSSPKSTGTPSRCATRPRDPRREWTDADIDRLQPPADGLQRNLEGLIINLRQYRVPPQEQYAIILKSNFGVIGHPLWKGFFALRESHGKIRLPGHYLLSLCR